MNKKPKIAFLHFAFIYSGGGEKLVLKQVDWFLKKGYQVDIFSPLVDKDNCFPGLLKKYQIKELLPGWSWLFKKFQVNSLIYVLAFLAPFLVWRLRNYQLIIGDHHPSAWFCYLAKKLYQVPYILYLAQPTRIIYQRQIDKEVGLQFQGSLKLSLLLGKLLRPLIFLFDQKCLAEAGKILANGKYAQLSLETIYGRKVINCPAGTSLPKKSSRQNFPKEIKVNGYVLSRPYILLTNRHIPHKKLDWMIEMMVFFKKIDCQLVITGQETKYTKKLKEKVVKLKLNKKIKLIGFVSEKNLAKLYANATVYVYSSPQEDFGMGVIEAQAYSCPVVAFCAGGIKFTVLDRQTGFLIKPYSLKDFAKKVKLLLMDRKLNQQFGRKARLWAREFSWQRHNLKLAKTIQEVIQPPSE